MLGGNNESTLLSNSKIVSPSIPELSFRHAYVPFLLHDQSSVHSNRKLQGYSHNIPEFSLYMAGFFSYMTTMSIPMGNCEVASPSVPELVFLHGYVSVPLHDELTRTSTPIECTGTFPSVQENKHFIIQASLVSPELFLHRLTRDSLGISKMMIKELVPLT